MLLPVSDRVSSYISVSPIDDVPNHYVTSISFQKTKVIVFFFVENVECFTILRNPVIDKIRHCSCYDQLRN